MRNRQRGGWHRGISRDVMPTAFLSFGLILSLSKDKAVALHPQNPRPSTGSG
jgi:hypothetical protein